MKPALSTPGLFRAVAQPELARVHFPLGALIWAMLVKIDFAALAQVKRQWRGSAVTLGANWLVKPSDRDAGQTVEPDLRL